MAKIQLNADGTAVQVSEPGLMSAILDAPGAVMGSEENTYYSTGTVRVVGMVSAAVSSALSSMQARRRQREGKAPVAGYFL